MFQSEKMAFANIFVYFKDKDKVVDAILESNLMHLIDSEKINTFLNSEKGVYKNLSKNDINKFKSKILESINLLEININDIDINKKNIEGVSLNFDKEIEKLDNINFQIESIYNKIKSINNEIERNKEMLEQLDMIEKGGNKFLISAKHTFLKFRLGSVSKDKIEELGERLNKYPAVIFPLNIKDNDYIFYLIYLRKYETNIIEILNNYNYKDVELTVDVRELSQKNLKPQILDKIEKLKKEKESLSNQLQDIKKEHSEYLKNLYVKYRILELKNKIDNYFIHTEKIYIISGWLPYRLRKRVINLLNKLVGENNYYIEIYKAEELDTKDIPVFYSNPKILKPFEDLTYNYGIPRYRTINPVPFVSISYLIMFGVMFGDLGHGFVLFLTGLIFKFVKKLRESALGSLANLIIYCGIASMIAGILFGSFFGYEDIIKPLWLRPLDNINTLFGLAIGFGIIIITVGIVINIINSIITKEYFEGIFSKTGLIGGVVYWGLLIVVSKAYVLKEKPSPLIMWGLILIPLLLMLLKEPLRYLIKRDKKDKLFKGGVGMYLMEYFVGLLEMGIEYISNTMSFIRVVAFGLAHTGLFIAIFSMVDILRRANAPSGVSLLTLILGNIGIILLEGLVVSIQAMRLEYYEFFGKFFEKTGKKYRPITLDI